VDQDMVIVVGHTRYQAAQKLGLDKVPVQIATGLTEAQIKAYRLLDNRANQDALWDDDMLKIEVQDIDKLDIDLALTGFDEKELDKLLFVEQDGLTDEDAVPEDVEPKVKKGELWQLGNHRLLCGDSTSEADVAKLMNNQKADLIFTDPPYGMSYGGGRASGSSKKGDRVKAHGMIINDDLRGDALFNLVKEALRLSKEHSKSGSASYVCLSYKNYTVFETALKEAGLEVNTCIVWDKKSIGLGMANYRPQHEFIFYSKGDQWLGNKSQSDIWSMSRGNTSGYKHPTQKPVELIEKAILNSSKSEDLVIDLFGGSGSTLLACEKTKRKSNLMDLDPKYCDVIIKRWEDFTGQTAKLLERGTDTNSLKEEEQWQDQKNTKLTQKKLLN
jgi:DNA modification methylase